MANRYWVGGTGNWSATTSWSASSGGPSGASVPVAGDNALFDQNGPYTVSMDATWAVNDFIATGTSITFSWSLLNGTISGSFDCVAGTVHTSSANTHTFTATTTGNIIRNKNACNQVFTGSGSWTLESDLPFSNNSPSNALSNGTLNCNGFAIQGSGLSRFTINSGTINFGTANHFIGGQSGFGGGLNINGGTVNFDSSIVRAMNWSINGGTINAGTATLKVLLGGAFSSIERTYPTIEFEQTGGTITGPMTVNNLTVAARTTAGVTVVNIGSRLTINGTLSTTGTAGNRRVWFRGTTYGLAQTLTVNSAPSLTDADFRDIYVVGASAPISGTRIGDLRGNNGITFDTPKTVYWVTAAGGSWSGNNWAASSGGAASTDNFPLAQDTAVIENTGLNTSATVTLDAAIPYFGAIDMSTRTNALTLAVSNPYTVYGNWTNGSGITIGGTATVTFSGCNIQTITTAGKLITFSPSIDSYGGTVELADAITQDSFARSITVVNGTFDTKNFNVTTGTFSSSNSNVRTIKFGSSTITVLNNFLLGTSTNLTFNAGTSLITNLPGLFSGGNLTFYNVSFTNYTGVGNGLSGINVFNDLTIAAISGTSNRPFYLSSNQTINGTLTFAGASPIRRISVFSDTLGTARILTAGTLVADDCDFRDITIAGTAAGSSPARAGDCGGNSGITFPSPKTVYWNLAGTQDWSADGWASSSGGAPDVNNFPLAQDTVVFDDTGSAGTVTIGGWYVGTVDMSARTTAMTLTSGAPTVLGDWKWGTGVTSTSNTSAITFAKRGTQTITSNGVTFGSPVTINGVNNVTKVQLADAIILDSARGLSLTAGEFDAISYSVTAGIFASSANTRLKMGSGTWTLSGTGTVWSNATTNFYKGTAEIVLSNTSTTARTFAGGSLAYNKLTIGGTTGTSTLTFTGNNQFTELASTKTVAHTIALGTTTQTFGKWTVTGTSGNVVTVTGTGTNHVIAGSATSGLDYLDMGTIGFSATSPGEFYAGANSTGSNATIIKTAPPSPRTLYWVGGTGNWNDTTYWSTSSGGAGGETIPTSLDDVVFDSSSNATDYTSTVNATSRCNTLNIAGPSSGNLTLAGTAALIIHGSLTLPSTGLTRTYTGAITLSGSTSGKTLTTNGVSLANAITINGVNTEWALGSAITNTSGITITNGAFNCSVYNIVDAFVSSDNANNRNIDFGSSTLTLSGATPITFGTTETARANLIVNAGTSQIDLSSKGSLTFNGNGATFYNVTFASIELAAGYYSNALNGANTFNNLTFNNITSTLRWGSKLISISDNQTINGTFTCAPGASAVWRLYVVSSTLNVQRTLTCNAVSLIDVDFIDIKIDGAAAPASGTRIGDGQGNSGITFTSKTVYWNLAAGGSWESAAWALVSGGTPDVNNFPLPQDTAVIEATGLNSGASISFSAKNGTITYLIGAVDMSARTSNTMTWVLANNYFYFFDNVTLGSGVTLGNGGGSGSIYWSKRNGTQELTSSGKSFVHQGIFFYNINGTLLLKDAASMSCTVVNRFSANYGTIDLDGYTLTVAGNAGGRSFAGSGISFGNNGTLIISAGSPASFGAQTISGSGTITMTSSGAKTFDGGGNNFSNVALNQGGAGTLTVTGNNTFKTITNTYSVTGATALNFGTTTQRITDPWTASGSAGNILTVQGTSATSPCTLIYTGNGEAANVDYLNIIGVKAYPL